MSFVRVPRTFTTFGENMMKFGKCCAAVPMLLAAACLAPGALLGQSTAASTAGEDIRGLNPAYFDTSADPCTDFFKYACGEFERLHPIPADRSSFGNFSLLFDENERILHAILEKAAAGGANRTSNEQKIGDYYASCINTAKINEEGIKPLRPEMERIAALTSKAQLTELLAHDQMINVNAFLSFGEQQDFKDATKQIAALDQGGMGLPERDYYLRTGAADEKIREQYVEYIGNIFKLLGEPEAKATSDAKKVMEIETALAKVSLDITSQRDPKNVYHITSIEDLQKLAPAIDWKKFLATTGAPPVTELNVTHPEFFTGLNALINSTDLDTIKTYLTWQLVNSTPSTSLPEDLDNAHFNFYGKV